MNIVYTAITGGYDNLHDPQYVTKGWQYICFSDVMLKSKIWDVKVVLRGNFDGKIYVVDVNNISGYGYFRVPAYLDYVSQKFKMAFLI